MTAEKLDQSAALQAMIEPESAAIDLRHFVLMTEPMRETKAFEYLREQGFQPYVPMFNRTMVYHVRSFGRSIRRSRTKSWPIFTGYLFLPLNMAWSFGPVERCPYLRQNGSKFLKNDGHYKVLSAKDLADIQRVEVIANFRDSYKLGDEVTVLDGPFAELTARIEELDDATRIKLLMDIFGRQTTIFASADQIAKVQ